jgi:hypothetical protein
MCLALTAAYIYGRVEPHGGDWNRFSSLRVVTFAHRALLISTMPHGAPRLAEIATIDTTRSNAGAPVRDGLRLINA